MTHVLPASRRYREPSGAVYEFSARWMHVVKRGGKCPTCGAAFKAGDRICRAAFTHHCLDIERQKNFCQWKCVPRVLKSKPPIKPEPNTMGDGI